MPHPPNRLAREKSPYLLQHAHNPVDWFPWGEEAFARARDENRPIFLSIGYSTCHWCHVMERESFENARVAALLNEHFVPVKLDREERPDVDRVYMTAMQLMGLGGGWPLNVFLTPELEPFYGGTYFPPETSHGRIGMADLLPRVADAWREQRDRLVEQGQHALEALSGLTVREGDDAVEPRRLFDQCLDTLLRSEDPGFGGFGREPKFPQPANLAFLFRAYARDPAAGRPALDVALRQLDAMMAGGLHDHLGGGFHRYSTDRVWLTPHFEKMLYDQAQLAWAYLAAWQLTGRDAYAAVARGIFDYVRRDLTSPEGAFYSAEDADSEGEEGRFYVWSPEQVAAVLPADDAQAVCAAYDVTPGGNFEGASILHTPRPLADVARELGRSPEELEASLARARPALLAARSRRPRPHRDDKVLTAWNGLMISAFARGARALADPALGECAERAAEFLWTRLRDPQSGALRRRWRDGEASFAGQLDDHAFAAYGFVDLYRATLDARWLERAIAVVEALVPRFSDDARGGWFDSPAGDPHLGLRMKSDYDGAEGSGASIAALVMLTLGRLLDRADWNERLEGALDLHARRIEHAASAMPQMLVAMDLAAAATRHIVVAGRRDDAGTRALVAEFDRRYGPDDLLLLADPAEPTRLAGLAPFTAGAGFHDGRATAYVCEGYACGLPTTDPARFAARLDERAPHPPTGVSA